MLLLAAVLCAWTVPSLAQDVMRLSGTVISKSDKQPLSGVSVTDPTTRRALAVTDLDGHFACNVRVGMTLRFSMVGVKPQNIKVKKGEKYLTVALDEENVALGEVVVAAKRVTDKIMPEPTDIEVKGNYFHVRTRVRVPREMFSHDTRLVVQPVIHDVTRDELLLMRPLVYDAKTYHRTQDRLYDFDMADSVSGDPLARYVTVKDRTLREKGRTNDIIGYSDSLYVEHVKDEFTCDVYMAIENYNRILYRDTTVIAKGTVNPLRWLDYSFGASEMTDPAYFPQPEVQLRDSRGEVNFRFPIGKAVFDPADPQNAAEVEKMRRQLDLIAQTKDATLQALTMEGTSSPDGRYASNLSLAQRRLDFALSHLRAQVPEEMRRGMDFKAKASVATWTDVARLLRADSLSAEAAQIDDIVRRYSGIDAQGRAVRKLPFYHSLLEAKYLPQLRHVGYVMNYAIFRQLTVDEIRQLYKEDYRQLSKFEFFQLYRSETDPATREKMMRQAVEIYPSFMTAANDLAAALINRQASDAELLRPFAGAKAPATVNANQIIALLGDGHYMSADSIADFLPDTESTHLLLAVNAVLNGRYADNFDVVAKTGKRNELVLLLAMKRNEEALRLSEELPDDEAISHYLRAICLNRAEQAADAYDELAKAIEMDPSLKSTARVDGDVNDLLLENDDKQ